MINYIEPKAESAEEHEIVVVLGEPVVVSQEALDRTEIISQTVNGHLVTVVVNSDGFDMIENEYAENPKPNQFEFVIDTDTHKVVSANYIEFNDTYKIGDKTNTNTFLDQFVGFDITNSEATIDTVTGATFSSESMIRALAAAIAAIK